VRFDPLRALAFAGIAVAIVGAVLLLSKRGISYSSVLDALTFLMVAVLVAAWLLFEGKKVSTIQLDDHGIGFMRLRFRNAAGFKLHAARETLKWSEVSKVDQRAHLIYIYGNSKKVVINTLLFDDAQAVVKLIGDSVSPKAGTAQ
jgi:hypothetical protein